MIQEGDLLPDINLRLVTAEGIKNFNLHENLLNKKILILCVPGAFTSTCHNQHLPPFIKGADTLINKKKIEQIYCVTTNDPYVLEKWRESLGESKINFLSDGNNEFLKNTKLIRNHDKSFMGDRLIRSVLLIENLIISKLICEDPGVLQKTSFQSILNTI
tara:strand:- start:825 stop:1304 length:480 start_codon:yes stop_codon:yes gene_type:complete